MSSYPPEPQPSAHTSPPDSAGPSADPSADPGSEPYDPQYLPSSYGYPTASPVPPLPNAYGGAPAGTPAPGQYSSPFPGAGYPASPNQPAAPYPASQYPASQYPGSQYPASPYPSGQYPAPYPGTPYPAYGYPPYGAGYAPNRGSLRPGVVTAASVVGYVLAGFLILCAIFLFTGAKVIDDLRSSGFDTTDMSDEFVLDGLLNLVSAGLLIAGGVQYSLRRPLGRAMVLIGGGIAFALSVYWVSRLPSVLTFYGFFFGALAVAVLILAVLPAGRRWLLAATNPPQ